MNSKIRHIAAQILRAGNELTSDVRLNTPGFGHAEPHRIERDLAAFISERGHKILTQKEAAAFAFRIALAVLKTEKIEDGFSLEIDDDAILPPPAAIIKGAA